MVQTLLESVDLCDKVLVSSKCWITKALDLDVRDILKQIKSNEKEQSCILKYLSSG